MSDADDDLIEEPAPRVRDLSGYKSGYVAGLAERSGRLRDAEFDIESLRMAVLFLCAAVTVLGWIVLRGDRHVVS